MTDGTDREKPQGPRERADPNFKDVSVEGPRLTPQGRTDPDESGEDATTPMGSGAKQGQTDTAEG